MRNIVFALLTMIAGAAWADDKQDQRNVYDVLRELTGSSTAGTAVDEQVTARIKRHMANLLYPVDLSSFARPEKDAKFRNVIILLQEQMGAPQTGILTWGQFDRLAEAAHDIEARPIGLPLKVVVTNNDGNYVSASGTVAGDNLAHKINHTRIECSRSESTCNVVSATIDPNTLFLWLDIPQTYEIRLWNAQTIIAVSEGPCLLTSGRVIATMTIDLPAETVTLSDTGSCLDKTPSAYNLIEGFPIAWKSYQEKTNKARVLVYEPAQRLIPPVQDASLRQKRH